MTLVAGTASVTKIIPADYTDSIVPVGTVEVVSGSGYAKAMLDAVIAENALGLMAWPFVVLADGKYSVLFEGEDKAASMSVERYLKCINTVANSRYNGLLMKAKELRALAVAQIAYFTANAVVSATISTSLGALQRAAGVDTTAPTATRTIPGTIA